jgi:hypothetical protein
MKKLLISSLIAISALSSCKKEENALSVNESKLKSTSNFGAQITIQDEVQVQKLKTFLGVLFYTPIDSVRYNLKDRVFSIAANGYKISYNEINDIYESANEYRAKNGIVK